MLRLLLRPRINDEESLVGYVERISARNCCKDSLGIYHLLYSSTRDLQNNMFSNEDAIILEDLTGQISDVLTSKSYFQWIVSHQSSSNYVLRNQIKFCPECVKIKGIHKYIWGFHPVCICLEHQRNLINLCPKCNKNITLTELLRSGICKRCSCKILTDAKNESIISPEYISSQTLIQRCFLEGDPLLRNINIRNTEDFFCLAKMSFHILEGLQSFLNEEHLLINAFTNKRNGSLDNQKSLISWGNFVWMYDNFPMNYYQVLNEFSKKNRKTLYEQKSRYEELMVNKEFSIIRKAYEHFWIGKLNEGSIRKDFSVFKSNEQLIKKRTALRREEVKHATGMGYRKMNRLREIGKLDLQLNGFGNQHRYIVSQDSLNKVIEDRNTYIHKHEAASILGITSDSITLLIKAEILQEYETSYAHNKMMLKRDIEDLLQEFSGTYQPSFKGISFHDALIKYSVIGLKIVDLMRFTKDEILHPRIKCLNGTLADVSYSDYELERCIRRLKEERRETKGYYFSEIMKILHIGEKRLKLSLIEKQIEPDEIIIFKDGRKRYLYFLSKVEEIRRALR
ncbi:TniQ family protein [Paenibacillus typhae]|uniref:TniQ protein n=1 Tax=Paenibacillus typhae TaxID=1174501 RepID=A0A1G8F6M2_9BACL|nr:TniQ family protein [Paenibacillus typhae]SDH77776.1 TniQ protein [Paenibacillus typhae]